MTLDIPLRCPRCGQPVAAKTVTVNYGVWMDGTTRFNDWSGIYYCRKCLLEMTVTGKLNPVVEIPMPTEKEGAPP